MELPNPICFLVVLLRLSVSVLSLDCVQCDKGDEPHYQQRGENRTKTALCLAGRLPPKPCPLANQTHCVTFYFDSPGSNGVEVLWRRCGYADEINRCSLFNFNDNRRSRKSRKSRKLRKSRKSGKSRNRNLRRNREEEDFEEEEEEQTDHVQVCARGCAQDGCLFATASTHHRNTSSILFSLLCIILIQISAGNLRNFL